MSNEIPANVLKILSDRQTAKRAAADAITITGKTVYIPTRAGETRCLVYRPEQDQPILPVLFDIHGGGFTNGYPEEDERFCRKLADALGVCVITIDYRLAPDHPFPCGFEDSYDVVRYVHARPGQFGIDPENITIVGHSAGGNLTAAICLKAVETGDFTVRCQVLDYAPLDLYTPADQKFYAEGAVAPELADIFNRCYRTPEQARNPFCSPACAEDAALAKLPPAIVLTAEMDSLREEAEQYALRLAQNGVPVSVQRFPGTVHGFTIDRFDEPQAQRAHAFIIEHLRLYL